MDSASQLSYLITRMIPQAYSEAVERIGLFQLQGTSMVYTSVHGHIFSFVGKNGELALRLKKEDRKRFMEMFDTCLMTQYGRTLDEYVIVPECLIKDTDAIEFWLRKSYSMVLTLQSKS